MHQHKFTAYSNYKKRTQQSMQYFISGMKFFDESMKWNKKLLSKNSDPLLRFFDSSYSYQNYRFEYLWESKYLEMIESPEIIEITNTFMQTLFIKPPKMLSANVLNIKDLESYEFMILVFNHYRFLSLSEYEYKPVVGRVFKSLCMECLQRIINIQKHYKYGTGIDNISASYECASPFLFYTSNFLRMSTMHNHNIDPVFLFGHAEILAPIITSLNVNSANDENNNFLAKKFSDEELVPMASNLAWVLLEKENTFYIQLRLNESPSAIPGLYEYMPYIYLLDDYLNLVDNMIKSQNFDFFQVNKNVDGSININDLVKILIQFNGRVDQDINEEKQ